MIEGLSSAGWLTIGEGALAVVLGVIVGALWVLVRIITGPGRGRHERRDP